MQNTIKMALNKHMKRYRLLFISGVISSGILVYGFVAIHGLDFETVFAKLLWPLIRLLMVILLGLVTGQLLEFLGWTTYVSRLAGPLFRFGNLGRQCSAAFTTAFFSGVTSNAMLLDFYKEGKISKRQLYLSNFINQMPAYFLHLPTTCFIVIPLTGTAGVIYFLITFAAALLRTLLFIIFGHFDHSLSRYALEKKKQGEEIRHYKDKKKISFWESIKNKIPERMLNIAVYVVPTYILVFILNKMGFFDLLPKILALQVVTNVMPIGSLSVVILSFAAEFTSGFAAAGALLDAGVITCKQTVLALLVGNVIASPIRTIRHQLPRYIGIFSPKMGTSLMLMGQGFRVLSIVIIGVVYYYLG